MKDDYAGWQFTASSIFNHMSQFDDLLAAVVNDPSLGKLTNLTPFSSQKNGSDHSSPSIRGRRLPKFFGFDEP